MFRKSSQSLLAFLQVEISGLEDDTNYEFRVLGYGSSITAASDPITSNTAKTCLNSFNLLFLVHDAPITSHVH